MLNIGIYGLGKMGQNHLRVLSLLKGVNIAFISDENAEVVERLSKQYDVPALSPAAAQAIQVDGVVIATPTITHHDYVKLVSKQTRNIFVEKPIAHTLEASMDLVGFAKAQNLNIQIGFIERFNPAVLALKTILEDRMGIVNVDFTRTNKISARITDVDVITDLMVHDIDLSLFLNGPAISVSAHGYAAGEMIDYASALIKHRNGRFSRIQASRITEKKKRCIEVTGHDIFVDCDLLRKEVMVYRNTETRDSGTAPYSIVGLQEAIEVKPQEALLSELQSFVNSIQAGGSASPDAHDGLAVMEVCDLIRKNIIKDH